MKEFLIGSKVFFSQFEDFVAMDTDILIIDDNPEYDTISYMENDIHYVRWRNMPKELFIEAHKYCYNGKWIQKFLCPEFAEWLGITIDDLKEMKFCIDHLDEQHGYVKVIYDSYIENNEFRLTDEQRLAAYEVYKKERMNL